MSNLALPISQPLGRNRRILEKNPLSQKASRQTRLPSLNQESNHQKTRVHPSRVSLKQSPIQTSLRQKDPTLLRIRKTLRDPCLAIISRPPSPGQNHWVRHHWLRASLAKDLLLMTDSYHCLPRGMRKISRHFRQENLARLALHHCPKQA